MSESVLAFRGGPMDGKRIRVPEASGPPNQVILHGSIGGRILHFDEAAGGAQMSRLAVGVYARGPTNDGVTQMVLLHGFNVECPSYSDLCSLRKFLEEAQVDANVARLPGTVLEEETPQEQP